MLPGEGHPRAGQRGQRSRIEPFDNRPSLEQTLGRDAQRVGEGARSGAVGEEGCNARNGGAGLGDEVAVRPGHGVVFGRNERQPVGRGHRCGPPGAEHVGVDELGVCQTGTQPFGEIGRRHPLQVRLLGECLGGHVESGCEREPFGGGVPRVQAGDDPVGPQGDG